MTMCMPKASEWNFKQPWTFYWLSLVAWYWPSWSRSWIDEQVIYTRLEMSAHTFQTLQAFKPNHTQLSAWLGFSNIFQTIFRFPFCLAPDWRFCNFQPWLLVNAWPACLDVRVEHDCTRWWCQTAVVIVFCYALENAQGLRPHYCREIRKITLPDNLHKPVRVKLLLSLGHGYWNSSCTFRKQRNAMLPQCPIIMSFPVTAKAKNARFLNALLHCGVCQ